MMQGGCFFFLAIHFIIFPNMYLFFSLLHIAYIEFLFIFHFFYPTIYSCVYTKTIHQKFFIFSIDKTIPKELSCVQQQKQ